MASYNGHHNTGPAATGFVPSSLRSNPAHLAEESIARDIEIDPEDAIDDDSVVGDEDDLETGTLHTVTSGHLEHGQHSMIGSYHRSSFASVGSRGRVIPTVSDQPMRIPKSERDEALQEERSLLRDNHLIPPKTPQNRRRSRGSISESFSEFLTRHDGHHRPGSSQEGRKHHLQIPGRPDEDAIPTIQEVQTPATERTALLGDHEPIPDDPDLPYGGIHTPEIDRKWEEAVAGGLIHTTWQREAKTLVKYSLPMMVTFTLQYFLTVTSIFMVGHLGNVELGAVTLGSMSANITGYAIYQGLATSLDTLCAQAYGSGKSKLVGLQMQRMFYFLLVATIPIGIIWICSPYILRVILTEPAVAEYTGTYLRIILAGAPGFAAFECGKRFVQAQGLFNAGLYVLIFACPFNALMAYVFVYQFKWGFIGAPIAVAITDNILPLGLFLYVRFVAGRECWNGFTRAAFQNWGPMIKLALPGLVMLEAEVLAFEVLTLASSYFGLTQLAAQSVVTTLSSIAFQLPFPLSIAASTRVANLIGATLSAPAKVTTRVSLYGATLVGAFNMVLLFALRYHVPYIFTSDPEVVEICARILPINAVFQIFDSVAATCNGVLRGLGRQEIGGYVQLAAYYIVAMPISFGTAFGLGWGIAGLWTGVAVALALVAGVEVTFLIKTDWERSVEDAKRRNELD